MKNFVPKHIYVVVDEEGAPSELCFTRHDARGAKWFSTDKIFKCKLSKAKKVR